MGGVNWLWPKGWYDPRSQISRFSRILGCIAAIAACGLLSEKIYAQTYTVADLGPLSDLPARADSGPSSINNSGSVAGANVVSGFYHAMVYSGSWNDLGTLGGSESLAGGINDSGQVAGYSRTAAGGTNAFLWTPGGTDGVAGNLQMRSLGTLPGGIVSEAYAINNSSQVTGYSDVAGPTGPRQHAFVYSAGSLKDIGQSLTVFVNSYGYGINSSGHVTGTAYNESYSTAHAFFYDGVTTTDLGSLGGVGCSPLALNDQDTLVGYVSISSTSDHAFRYTSGTATDLGTLGGHYSYALAINNSNTIVGGSFSDSKDSIYHAFIWANGAMTDLNTLLDQTGAGWTLIEARAINDAGQIAGVGNFGGANHAFRLTPATTSIQPPRIQSLQMSGSSVIIQFTTVLNQHYALQGSASLLPTSWADLQTNIIGTGGILSITNSVASPLQFYRVQLAP
jgi:probable HAF family extracellular repeat protein